MTHTPRGLILFAHGARDARWAEPFQALAQRTRQMQPALQVRLAFLELMQPSLMQAAEELVLVGCRHVAVQPVFLGAGGHVRRDLPLLVAAVQAKWPELHISVATAIGEVEAVLDAMATAALRAALPSVSYDGSVAADAQGTAK